MLLKKISLIMCVLLISASMLTIHSASANGGFSDIPKNHQASKEINYLANLGVIGGYQENGKTYYKPQNNVTKAQVAKMVVIASNNKPLKVQKSSFTDVKVGTEQSGYIERAVQLGFFEKDTTGKFSPNVYIKRDEMSFVLSKAFKLKDSEFAKVDSPFIDVGITHNYLQYINAIYYAGITQGDGDFYKPNSNVTRSQFALFVARAKSDDFRLDPPVLGDYAPDTSQVMGVIQVTTDGLNIRKTPDTSSKDNIVGVVNKGGRLSVYEINGSWLKVTYKGAFAYVSKNYAEFLDADGQALGTVQKTVKAKQNMNLYFKATSSSKVIASVKQGASLPVHKSVNGYYLTVVNGLPGFIVAQSTEDVITEKPPVEPTPPPTSGNLIGRATVANLNVRNAANDTAAVLGKLSKGETVQVNSISGYWAEIVYKGQKAYTHKSYLKLINQSGNILKDRVIIIDPGHGGKDPGKPFSATINEKTITLKVSTRVKEKLAAAGANVQMTRTGDTYPSLQDRVTFTDKNYGELFVSIHVNAAGSTSAQGTETYYAITNGDMNAEDNDLATFINNNIVKDAGMKDRKVKKADFYVIKNMLIPSVLVELGFLSNAEDRAKLTSDKYVEIYAEAIYKGIVQYYSKK
ncbi:MAG: N-acetylmuramoyl-L-alanine amidase [Lysinibacillus sp.]